MKIILMRLSITIAMLEIRNRETLQSKVNICKSDVKIGDYADSLVFMLSIAINRAEHVCATVIIKHNYMLMCNHKIVINIMLCLLNSTGHI